ncbi:adenosylcobinamide kinase/adenosylcobinamide-phosphate guanylyltransferase [Bacillus ectoiniformans]|uniref:bifunctional adenosylcobinamide kinase/adenosylcobinamide-phosphate guanylyltransferase n=1 Tax=Bacillus ectoiniformans TaxID=1494429 RepID=UPI0019585977|nr:bifunctional adenosylcobinamide kinase/adenosylcobinamide-phosphate guanylyltransferase [Bacillus ectoiniformans]MBM7649552.1 adenosylcobinamide kinase/adenosylcobinamide-phosphate guanylyltransferase [Bacillus ectoiniformans]
METTAKLIFVTGGVRSGKSRMAEEAAQRETLPSEGKLYYIACGKVTDSEMSERVRHHQVQRYKSQGNWLTVEQPDDLASLAEHFKASDVLLIDCLTTWLTNEWFDEAVPEEEWACPMFQQSLKERITGAIDKLRKRTRSIVIVSNELSYEALETPLVFYYAKVLGELHQYLVRQSNQVFLVEYGQRLLLKGGDPE